MQQVNTISHVHVWYVVANEIQWPTVIQSAMFYIITDNGHRAIITHMVSLIILIIRKVLTIYMYTESISYTCNTSIVFSSYYM